MTREEEDVDTHTGQGELLAQLVVENILWTKQVLFMVGSIQFRVFTVLQLTGPDRRNRRQEYIQLSTNPIQHGLCTLSRNT